MKNERLLLRDARCEYPLSLLTRLLSKWLKPCFYAALRRQPSDSIDLTVTITITARPDDTFDLTCAMLPELNRDSVERASLRVEVVDMLAELATEMASASFWPSGRDW